MKSGEIDVQQSKSTGIHHSLENGARSSHVAPVKSSRENCLLCAVFYAVFDCGALGRGNVHKKIAVASGAGAHATGNASPVGSERAWRHLVYQTEVVSDTKFKSTHFLKIFI